MRLKKISICHRSLYSLATCSASNIITGVCEKDEPTIILLGIPSHSSEFIILSHFLYGCDRGELNLKIAVVCVNDTLSSALKLPVSFHTSYEYNAFCIKCLNSPKSQ